MIESAAPGGRLGLIDGSIDTNSRRFHVVLDHDAVVQLDELVVVEQPLPDGSTLCHYGIVVETTRHIEGARYASDTAHIDAEVMPGETARRVEVQILRTQPEMWLAPEPGMPVTRATGDARKLAVFHDQMESALAVGLDQSGQSVHLDLSFLDGTRGAHINISGISGVATKTSYALFLLYMLLETADGLSRLGVQSPNTKAIIFNVKGEDLMFLDRSNRKLDNANREKWATLGVDEPSGFGDVALYSPRMAGETGTVVADVRGRDRGSVIAYGWTPWDFIRKGLLQFLFTDDDDRRTQVGFVEQQVRVQLARHACPLEGDETGAVVILDHVDSDAPYDFERIVSRDCEARPATDGHVVRDYGDLLTALELRLVREEDPAWHGNTQANTVQAFIRRLFAMRRRVGHLSLRGPTRSPSSDGSRWWTSPASTTPLNAS